MRLNKYISGAGVCSRREADRLILSGQVTVDGRRAGPGMQVDEGSTVEIGGRMVERKNEKVVLAVYKPVGVVCTEDARERNNIVRFLDYPVRVTYAGRLDKDSEGLLLMTNDGDLANAIMRARYRHEKEYHVTVCRPVTEEFLENMRNGVHIRDVEKGLDETTRPCAVKKIGARAFSITLTQGLNRQIRRMCAALGYPVENILRVRVMGITLDGLRPGEYRKLTEQELAQLYGQAKNGQNVGTGGSSESGGVCVLPGIPRDDGQL